MRIKDFTLEHNVDYGVDHKTGYSVSLNGSYVSVLEPWLIVALWKAWRTYRRWRK